MKNKTALILLSVLLTLACLFASCNSNEPIFSESDSSQAADDYAMTIESLEEQILELQKNQYLSEIERQEEITRLEKLLAQLKAEADQTPSNGSNEQASTNTQVSGKFLYTVTNDLAVITGYTGSDETLVIPSVIDGYTVSEISDSAFSSKQIKSVIITSGITKIGWFSFQECSNLSSVTIPSSVTSIGYSAFFTEAKGFTIYCASGSFAQQYAKSYGIAYVTI